MKRLFFIIILLFSLFLGAKAGKAYILTPDDGLSNSHISQICQDSYGFIWIATENGLNKFDGYTFTVYTQQADDSTSLLGNYVYCVKEDSKGRFWVASRGGLQLYNREKDCFEQVLIRGEEPFYLDQVVWILEDHAGNIWVSYPGYGILRLSSESLSPTLYYTSNTDITDGELDCAFEDHLGNLWLGSHVNGVFLLNPQNSEVIHFRHDASDPRSLSDNRVFSICEDHYGRILVATLGGGVNVYDYPSSSFSPLVASGHLPDPVFSLMKDSKGNVWMGTDGYGLIKYDEKGEIVNSFDFAGSLYDINRAKVHHIYEDVQGNMWVALYQKGVLFIPAEWSSFKNYTFNPFDQKKNLGSHCVISLLEDSTGDVWVGTDGDGLYRINSKTQEISHYTTRNTYAFRDNIITALFEDEDRNIWIGTYLKGMFRYNRNAGLFDSHYYDSPDPANRLTSNYISSFAQDRNGILWIGLSGGALNALDLKSGKIRYYSANIWVFSLFLDSNDVLWIGTSSGINRFDVNSRTFLNSTRLNEQLTTNLIYSIAQDSQGDIWIGGYYGLYCIDYTSETVKHYTTDNGLPDNMINGITEDEGGNLWLSTGRGLCKFDPETETAVSFYAEDGIQSNEFRRGSYQKGRDGRMYFGGINGLTSFFPSEINVKNSLLRLTLSNLLVYNEPVVVGQGILEKALDQSDKIRLKYNHRSFTFQFGALEYSIPHRVRYYIQMENFDKRWRQVHGGSRSVTYTNLNPGKYIFKVKATLDGINFLTRDVQVVIDPPLWLSPWAKFFYFLLLVALLFMLYRYVLHRMKQGRILMEQEQEKQMSESKLQFFTDISHEIRTPLTLIIGPLEKLMEAKKDRKTHSSYQIIHQNALRILRLINQLMDLRAVEHGRLKLKVEPVSISRFVEHLMDSFREMAETKRIDFRLITDKEVPEELYIDKDCLDKIVFNLLSNAFKFTPQGGTITVSIERGDDLLRLIVQDSGIGIEKDKQDLIFNRFFQVRENKANVKVGTGIGLHLSKLMAELHRGSIGVESEAGRGSSFIVTLPLSKEVYTPEEFGVPSAEEPVTMFQPSFPVFDVSDSQKDKMKNMGQEKDRKMHSVLVVEDDVDILRFIHSELSYRYKVYTANNGKEGLNLALRTLPDVIISDIVMPEMDGLTLCKILKSDSKTCHIPIVLLTAKTSVEQRIEGLEMGADSYIPKPFNVKHLETRVEKLIDLRNTLKEKFSGSQEEKMRELNVISSDEKLLQKLDELIRENMSNPDLSVESLSKELGLSRVHLNRRMKAIIRESPSTYIRNCRLKQAAWLLTHKRMTIAEVAYTVGFSSHAYFSNLFKEHFKMSPTEYVEVNREESGVSGG